MVPFTDAHVLVLYTETENDCHFIHPSRSHMNTVWFKEAIVQRAIGEYEVAVTARKGSSLFIARCEEPCVYSFCFVLPAGRCEFGGNAGDSYCFGFLVLVSPGSITCLPSSLIKNLACATWMRVHDPNAKLVALYYLPSFSLFTDNSVHYILSML